MINSGIYNKNQFILGLLEEYKHGLNDKKINLDDDFIKFVRFSEFQLNTSGVGIHGMITNNTYLDGLTHRQMRLNILKSFTIARISNLHGSSKKKEKAPDGTQDENVFDITVGVSIGLFCRAPLSTPVFILYADFWGSREGKIKQLTENSTPIRWSVLNPEAENYFFVPKDFTGNEEYRLGWSISDIFSISQNGIKTDRDELFFDFDKNILSQRIQEFYDPQITPEFRDRYQVVASSSYDIEARRLATKFSYENIRLCLYRPMDIRWLYYDPNLTSRPAERVMKHMLGGQNLGLIATRQTQEKWDVLVTNQLCGHKSCAAYDINSLFPLFLYQNAFNFERASNSVTSECSMISHPNLTAGFIRALSEKLNIPQDGEHSLPNGLTPEDIFYYAYTVFHSPTYRTRYAEFLKIDFPRLPLTSSLDLYRALAVLGGELVSLHLLESPKVDDLITQYHGTHREVAKVGWTPDQGGTVWIDAGGTKKDTRAGTSGFQGVPENVWKFHIGGYQVCEKWLKDRKGRTLSDEDLTHYQRVVVALHETIRLMAEIDSVIDLHGGWPGAFQSTPVAAAS